MDIALDFQRYWLDKELSAIEKVRRIESKSDEWYNTGSNIPASQITPDSNQELAGTDRPAESEDRIIE